MRLARLPLLVLALVTATAPAWAQPVATSAVVLSPAAEIAAGDKAVRAKDWAGALQHFQAVTQAPGASASANVQLHAQLGAANALYQLGRAGEAYDAYDLVQNGGAKLSWADKTLVTSRLKDLATKTGSLSVRVEEPGAAVDVDGKALGTSPLAALLRVAVGPHEVHVTKAGFVPFTSRVDVAPDVKAAVDVTLVQQATKAHLVVQSPGAESLRVIVDGVDVGATPWEGDLAPGPHEVSGRSSSATAAAQTVTLVAGDRAQVSLVTSATLGHMQVRTSDGKGLIYVDGVIKGEGAYSGDAPPGPHTIVVTREGYDRYEKAVTIGPRETWAETVTLKPTVSAAAATQVGERPFAGSYGGFGLTGLFGVGGQGTTLDTACKNLGASSCDTPGPVGGGAFGYVGYTWDPVGFELMLGAEGDTTGQTAHFTGDARFGGNTGISGDEKFRFVRFGGLVALRVRATASFGSLWRASIAGGVGLSYKELAMARTASSTATPKQGSLSDTYAPDPVTYVSPAITIEGSVSVRVSPTVAVSAGLLLWADNASTWGTNASPPSPGRSLASANPPATAPVATPQYSLATGPQVFLGPFVGVQFGP